MSWRGSASSSNAAAALPPPFFFPPYFVYSTIALAAYPLNYRLASKAPGGWGCTFPSSVSTTFCVDYFMSFNIRPLAASPHH